MFYTTENYRKYRSYTLGVFKKLCTPDQRLNDFFVVFLFSEGKKQSKALKALLIVILLILLLMILYFFICSLDLLSDGFKLIGGISQQSYCYDFIMFALPSVHRVYLYQSKNVLKNFPIVVYTSLPSPVKGKMQGIFGPSSIFGTQN